MFLSVPGAIYLDTLSVVIQPCSPVLLKRDLKLLDVKRIKSTSLNKANV